MNVSFGTLISDFDPANSWAIANGWRQETFSWSDVLRAAIVAGYPRLTLIPSRQFSRWRTAGFHLALRHARGQLVQPPEWGRLDPSEKGAASSLLGLVVTKLLVERLLTAPTFLFLDVFFTVTFPAGVRRRRPDFVARTVAGEWIPVEAKGKCRFRWKTLTNGKVQACALGTVNGQPVSAAVVCVTSFRSGVMQARFADPDPEREKSGSAEIDSMAAFERYYHQLDRFKQFSERLDEITVPGTELRLELWQSMELDVQFGVLPELQQALEERSLARVEAVLKELAATDAGNRTPFLGLDGIVVIPGRTWHDESYRDLG